MVAWIVFKTTSHQGDLARLDAVAITFLYWPVLQS